MEMLNNKKMSICVNLPYYDDEMKRYIIPKDFLGALDINDLSKLSHSGKRASVFSCTSACGRCAVRMRILDSNDKNSILQIQQNWTELVALHRRFPDIVALPVKSCVLPYGDEAIGVDVSEWCTETFEAWASRSSRTVGQIVQAVDTILEKFDLLNASGVFHRDSHGNNVMRRASGEWRIIDWDEVILKNMRGHNFDSIIFLAFAVLVLQKAMLRHRTLFDAMDDLRCKKKYRFDYNAYHKCMGDNGYMASFYKNKIRLADAAMSKLDRHWQ